jgi:hypothetical protein
LSRRKYTPIQLNDGHRTCTHTQTNTHMCFNARSSICRCNDRPVADLASMAAEDCIIFDHKSPINLRKFASAAVAPDLLDGSPSICYVQCPSTRSVKAKTLRRCFHPFHAVTHRMSHSGMQHVLVTEPPRMDMDQADDLNSLHGCFEEKQQRIAQRRITAYCNLLMHHKQYLMLTKRRNRHTHWY